MTNEQIIINSIDVSNCRYLFDDVKRKNVCSTSLKDCKKIDTNYCYYKQLQRKIKQIEHLKSEIKNISDKLDDALDPDVTESEESFDLFYEISEQLENLIREIEKT